MLKYLVLTVAVLASSVTFANGVSAAPTRTLEVETSQHRLLECLTRNPATNATVAGQAHYLPRTTATRIARKISANDAPDSAFRVGLRSVDHRTTVLTWEGEDSVENLDTLKELIACAGVDPRMVLAASDSR